MCRGMPSVTGVAQAGTGLGDPLTRTRHSRQAPVGSSRSSWQSAGRCTPIARSASASDGASGKRDLAAVHHGVRHVFSTEQPECHPIPAAIDGVSRSDGRKISLWGLLDAHLSPHNESGSRGTTIAPCNRHGDLPSCDARAGILVLAAGVARGCATPRDRGRTRFPQRSTRTPAIARSGLTQTAGRRPTLRHCHRALAWAAEDGLDPLVYRAEHLGRQAAALEHVVPFRLSTWRRSM